MLNINVYTMHECYHLLEIYDDLIYDDLIHNSISKNENNLAFNYLNEEFGNCKNMKIVNVKVDKQGEKITEKIKISNAHPSARKYFSQREFAFKNDFEGLFPTYIIKELDINSEKVLFTINDTKNNVQSLGVCEDSSWSEIEYSRIKYCYYYQVLEDCKKNLKKILELNSYELDDSQFRKLVFNVQKTLMNHLKELMKTHNVNPKALNYQLKSKYTNQDCVSLIYISIIEKLNFIYEDYYNEFDKSYPVPYFSEKLNVNHIDKKIRYVKKQFKIQNIDPLLIEVLDKHFDRIIKLDHPVRLTYHELDYFIELLNKLSNHLLTFKESNLTTDDIVSLLISSEFNNFQFTQYFTNEIKNDLKTISDLHLKRTHLIGKQTLVKQSFKSTSTIYDNVSRDISIVLHEWIESEIKLVNEYINSEQININQNESFKLKTTLPTPELAVLFKILSDCKIIISKSKSDIGRWLAAGFFNKSGETISIDQARNNLYNTEPAVLEKIKSYAIMIVNVCNEKLSKRN